MCKRLVLLVLSSVLLVASCGSDGGGDDSASKGKGNGGSKEPKLTITSPENDKTADCPVRVRVRAEGFRVLKGDGGVTDASSTTTKPADEENKSDATLQGRLHAYVDADPPGAGKPIPEANGLTIVDLRRTTGRIETLKAGDHKVTVVAAAADRMQLPDLTATSSFKIEECAAQPPKSTTTTP